MTAKLNDDAAPDLPAAFCWTKFGAEAGEDSSAIFRRKELERHRNEGVFLWGIGHSIRPSLLALLALTRFPEVIFSPIKSRASSEDLAPSDVVLWSEAIGYDGRDYPIPRFSVVTSRWNARRPASQHFALVCETDAPLTDRKDEPPARVYRSGVRNLVSGSIVGASQVTSIVRRTVPEPDEPGYPVSVRVRLVYPYLLRLEGSVAVPRQLRLKEPETGTFESRIDSLIQLRSRVRSTATPRQLPLGV